MGGGGVGAEEGPGEKTQSRPGRLVVDKEQSSSRTFFGKEPFFAWLSSSLVLSSSPHPQHSLHHCWHFSWLVYLIFGLTSSLAHFVTGSRHLAPS